MTSPDMTRIVKVKTGSKFEEIGSYSRLVAVDDWIYVSNTAGRNPETKEIAEDLLEQTQQVFTNIEIHRTEVQGHQPGNDCDLPAAGFHGLQG